MEYIAITSFANPKVKFASGLKEKKNRDNENKLFIEGFREITRALKGNLRFDSLFVAPELFLGKNETALIDTIGVKTFALPSRNFEKISMRDRPDGLIAIAEIPDYSLDKNTKPEGDLFLIIEGVEKPGNLGTIIRTAEGAGVSGIFVADPRVDLFNPNVIRSSTGTLFTANVKKTSIENIIHYFNEFKIPIIAVTPESRDVYFDQNFQGKVAFLFGSEQYGLSEYARSHFAKSVSLPMRGEADSLNLAMSCGILLYEVIRQRSK